MFDVVRLLGIISGALIGSIIGMNSERFVWPRVIQMVAERISTMICRINEHPRQAGEEKRDDI